MRTLFVVILFCVSLAYGEDTNITSTVSESQENNGQVKYRLETTFRGKEKVLATLSHRNEQGVMTVTTRCYFVAGRLGMIEGVESREIILCGSRLEQDEVFIHQADGLVKPVSSKALEAHRKHAAVLQNAAKMSESEFREALEETYKTIQDERKAQNDKK